MPGRTWIVCWDWYDGAYYSASPTTDPHGPAYGSRMNHTLKMDPLAKTGMRLENCFAVNSIYSPSRATILTGKYM
jgi:arylsulfatase A-like enzyme